MQVISEEWFCAHFTGRETEAHHFQAKISMLCHYAVRLIETPGMTVEMGGFVSWVKGIEMAPKVCIKVQMKAQIRQEKTWRASACWCNGRSASHRRIQKVSSCIGMYICSSLKFLLAWHCWLSGLLQKGRGDGFALMCIPGTRHVPRRAAWFISNDTSLSL